jgi:anthranilate synthase component 1
MGLFEDGVVFDHTQNQAYYYYRGENRLQEIEQLLKEPAQKEGSFSYTPPVANVKQADFEALVQKAKAYIYAGDIFQVVPSKRLEFQYSGSLLCFYKSLRQINPSPYMFYYKAGDRQIVGASPEMLVRVDKRQVMTFPIAGTIPFTADAEENKRLEKQLLNDDKERAEHVMLVDLARNDIGRISKPGTVTVQSSCGSPVQPCAHIVSQVVGDLKDILESMMPLKQFSSGHSHRRTKVRAMEIIEELEPIHRGPYAGAVDTSAATQRRLRNHHPQLFATATNLHQTGAA